MGLVERILQSLKGRTKMKQCDNRMFNDETTTTTMILNVIWDSDFFPSLLSNFNIIVECDNHLL